MAVTKRDEPSGTLHLFGAQVIPLPLAFVPEAYRELDEHALRGRIGALVKLDLDLDAVVALAVYLESEAFRAARSRRIRDISANSLR